MVADCAGSGLALEIAQGEELRLLVPLTFETVLDAAWASVTLQFLADGTTYPESLSAVWDDDLGRYILILDAEALPLGTCELIVPLGNGESVVLTIEACCCLGIGGTAPRSPDPTSPCGVRRYSCDCRWLARWKPRCNGDYLASSAGHLY
ncbi:hypothetical protein ACFLSW_06275 [Candidatus Bipolaricaulota bacterium]